MILGQIHIFIPPKNGGNLGQRLDRNGKLLNLGQHVELRQEGPGARKKDGKNAGFYEYLQLWTWLLVLTGDFYSD